ncbi:SDR family NAD(P)-dependent oxidoreductase [Lentzea jiangxiensis]|uniref:NAD(P)-dependent dehydrogenase, short-chain alcohol dehydrogenase family n=1 Tax=Lentzea jiangxiensis TaxID=641025 RepID=A0A1H0LWN9_9PSEU|nr:glucose 1-dehydrogenase [Lentzea jiangxiensis]SDO72555.1 NAD(P)-dependent dehydrogenase, short-chain alcohol dehydrogenase family [Lentzea jiangxiensis]
MDEIIGDAQAAATRSILDRFRLTGRSALVTGAGQGIGRAFAHALGEAGAQVAVVDLSAERAEEVAGELLEKGVKAISIQADAADERSVESFVRTTVEQFGRLDIAVNNAGINLNSAAEETTLEEWDMVHDLNLRGVFIACQHEAKAMFPHGYGKIINTASMASMIVPHPQKQVSYNVSKGAVVSLTRTLAAEWADRGIRVNCISPGIIRTALIEESETLAPLVDEWVSNIPAGRLGEVSDLQGAVVYLAGEVSDYMTGHNLAIEGGQTLW